MQMNRLEYGPNVSSISCGWFIYATLSSQDFPKPLSTILFSNHSFTLLLSSVVEWRKTESDSYSMLLLAGRVVGFNCCQIKKRYLHPSTPPNWLDTNIIAVINMRRSVLSLSLFLVSLSLFFFRFLVQFPSTKLRRRCIKMAKRKLGKTTRPVKKVMVYQRKTDPKQTPDRKEEI